MEKKSGNSIEEIHEVLKKISKSRKAQTKRLIKKKLHLKLTLLLMSMQIRGKDMGIRHKKGNLIIPIPECDYKDFHTNSTCRDIHRSYFSQGVLSLRNKPFHGGGKTNRHKEDNSICATPDQEPSSHQSISTSSFVQDPTLKTTASQAKTRVPEEPNSYGFFYRIYYASRDLLISLSPWQRAKNKALLKTLSSDGSSEAASFKLSDELINQLNKIAQENKIK